MAVFEGVLKASKDVDYVVRGGRSYLEKIPKSALRVLGAALPEFFTKNDWNVSVAGTDGAEVLCARTRKAFAAAKIKVKVKRTKTDKATKYLITAGRVQVGWITDASRSAVGLSDPRCPAGMRSGARAPKHASGMRKGVKYSSLCDCLSQMHRALSSATFTKREKTSARCRAVLNMYTGKPTAYTASLIKLLKWDLDPPAQSRTQKGGGYEDDGDSDPSAETWEPPKSYGMKGVSGSTIGGCWPPRVLKSGNCYENQAEYDRLIQNPESL